MEKICQISRQILYGFVLVVGFMLTACSIGAETVPTNTVTEATSLSQKPFTPTLAPSSTPTVTPSPGSPTLIPPSQTSITPVPTLLIEEQESYFLNLLETNGGCQLPCFMGIQPGKAVWEEARVVEGPVYFRESYLPNDAGAMTIYTNLEALRNFDLVFWGSKDIIERIRVDARLYPDDPYEYIPAFARVMSQYSLVNVLSEYGVPSRILLAVVGVVEAGGTSQAEILLFYDHFGILIKYHFWSVALQDRETSAFRVCPDYGHNDVISLYLQGPQGDTPLERMIGDQNDYYLNPYLQPLEEITSLSVKDFYEIFIAPDNTGCFEIQ